MPLVNGDAILKPTGLNQRALAIEIACRLSDGDRLELRAAAELAEPPGMEFADKSAVRRNPWMGCSPDEFCGELAAPQRLGE